MNDIIARNLKKLREFASYTQEDVSKAIGITRSAYSNYESGEREMPYDVMEKISDLYGCEMIMLFEENQDIESQLMVSAFRIEGMSPQDTDEIMRFKDIVKSYLKLEAIEDK